MVILGDFQVVIGVGGLSKIGKLGFQFMDGPLRVKLKCIRFLQHDDFFFQVMVAVKAVSL